MKSRMIALTMLLSVAFASNVCAFIDYGNGVVELEYGESYGSVAAAYGINYYNLGYYNGCDPDSVVVQPGDTINIGTASANSYYSGCDDGSSASGYQPCYNEYSTDYSYYDEYGNYCEGYTTLGYDGGYVDYGTVTTSGTTYASDTTYSSGVCTTGVAESLYNINVACQLNNNIVIPAGGTYRASDYIGAGDASMGFVLAPCFDGQGGYVDGYGGGICSVTSSIYMAGKSAGLTTIEANQHNFGDGTTGITSYAPENQAMYNYGTSDLVMVNNTGHDLVLSCTYGDNGISASFN